MVKHWTIAVLIITAIVLSHFDSSADNGQGDIVIIFDQSASMTDYNPKLVSKLWVTTFINTFSKPYDVVLAGFAQDVYQHMRISTGKKEDLAAFRKKMESVKSSGLVTDFETPFEYLNDYKNDISFIVFVTDGEPDVWDVKRPYLSKKIRSSAKYKELNLQLEKLKNEGLSKRQIHDRLNAAYERRNLELINELLERLKEKYGKRLVFLDISGKHGYLEKWAQIAGAELVVVSSESGRSPANELQAAFLALQKKASIVIDEPLPEDFAEKIELAPLPDKAPEPEVLPEPIAKISPRELTDKTPDDNWSTWAITIAVLFAGTLILVIRRRKLAEDKRKAEEEARHADGVPSFDLLEDSLRIDSVRKKFGSKAAADLLDDNLNVDSVRNQLGSEGATNLLEKIKYVDSVRKKFGSIAATSLEAANKFIDIEIELAEEEGNEDRLRILREEKLKYNFDKRIELRVPVPPGAMDVHWKDMNGESHSANVINISMHGISFDAPGFDASKVDAIEYYVINQTFQIVRCKIARREEDRIVAILEEFAGRAKDRMKWIEILTRVGEAG